MAERYLLVRTSTGVVSSIVVGAVATADHDAVLVIPALAQVGKGWVRQQDGTFIDPYAGIVTSAVSDADRIAELERRLLLLDDPTPVE